MKITEFFINLKTNKISKIAIHGHKYLTSSEIISFLNLNSVIPVGDIDLEKLNNRLLSNSRIKKSKVSIRTNTILSIEIEEKIPLYLIQTDQQLCEIDQDGSILEWNNIREGNLPIINLNFQITENKIHDTRFESILKKVNSMFQEYPSLRSRISEIIIGNDGDINMYVDFPKRIKVLFGSDLNNDKIKKFYSSLAYAEHENVSAKLLDIRGIDAILF